MYYLLAHHATVDYTLSFNAGVLEAQWLAVAPPGEPVPNDIFVTKSSALGDRTFAPFFADRTAYFEGAFGKNHSSIAEPDVCEAVVAWLVEAERLKGDLAPR